MSTSLEETSSPATVAAAPWGPLRAVGDKGVALVDQALVSGTNFATNLLIGRLAGRDELGAYQLGFDLLVVAICVQDALVSSPYVIYGNRAEGEQRQRLAGAALALLALLGLLLSATLAVVAWPARWQWPAVSPVLAVLALTVPWVMLREFRRRFAYAHHHAREALVFDVVVTALQLAGLFGLVVAGALGGATAHAAIGLACAVGGVTSLALVRRRFACRGGNLTADGRRYWAFGRWQLAGQLTALGYGRLVTWLLAARLGTTATGAYAACLIFVTLANPFILGFGNVVSPSVARAFVEGGPARVRQVLLRSALPLGLGALLLTAIAAVAGGPLIAWMYGPDYSGLGTTAALVGLLVPLVATSTLAEHGLRAVERPQVNFTASLVSLIVTAIVAWALIGPYQVAGAAAGLVAGEVAGSVIRWSAFWRLTRVKPEGSR